MVVAAAVRVVVCLLFCYVVLPQADYSGAAFTFYAERRKPGSLQLELGDPRERRATQPQLGRRSGVSIFTSTLPDRFLGLPIISLFYSESFSFPHLGEARPLTSKASFKAMDPK